MTTGENVDFNEFHRWRLEKITGLVERIALFTSAHWSYAVQASRTTLLPSDFKDLLENKALSVEERQALGCLENLYSSIAFSEIVGAITCGIMDQRRDLGEEPIMIISQTKKRTVGDIMLESDEARASSYCFSGVDTDETFEVIRTKVKSIGLDEKPIDVEVTTVRATDQLIVEWISIIKSSENITVHQHIQPTEDELLSRLMKVSGLAKEEISDFGYQLYDTGFAAMVGFQGADKRIAEIMAQTEDPEIFELCESLLERFRAVQASRTWESQTNLPSVEKLEEVTNLLEVIADTLEG